MVDDVDNMATGGVGQPSQLLEMFLSGTLIEGLQGSSDEYNPIQTEAVVDQLGRNVAS